MYGARAPTKTARTRNTGLKTGHYKSEEGVGAQIVSDVVKCCHDPSAPFAALTALRMTQQEESGPEGGFLVKGWAREGLRGTRQE